MTVVSDRKEPHPGGFSGRLSAIACFFYAFFLFMPLRGPELTYDPLNASWQLALSYCFTHGKQFGTDVVFNFGPLGCCYPRLYYPDTYLLTLTFWLLLTIVVVFSILRIADDLFQSKPLKYMWVIALISLSGLFSDVTCFAVSLLICYRYFLFLPEEGTEERKVSLDLYLLSALAGMLALSKFTFFLAALWSLVFVSLDQLLKRKSPNYFFCFLLTFLFGWLLSHQSLGNLLPFFRNSWSIARGYSEAMAVSQVSEYLNALPTALLVAGLIYLISQLIAQKSKLHVLLGSSSFVGLSVLIFKAGFTRNEASTLHVVIPALCFAFLSILLLPNTFKMASRLAVKLAIVMAVVSNFILLPSSYGTWIGIGPALIFFTAIARSTNNFSEASESIQGKNPQNKEYLAYMAKLKNDHPIPAITGSADIYPWEFADGLANNLELDPRPIFQGYQAYSEDLLDLDAQHLRNDSAPKSIVFSVSSAIDNRLPALDDSPSWLELLRHYDIYKRTTHDLILKRRTIGSRNIELSASGSISGKLGEQIQLPDFGEKIIWSTISINRTPIGILQAFIYKALPPNITLQLADGTIKTYTAPRQMLSTGFVLSPGVFTTGEFAGLYESKQDPKRKVSSIKIEDISHLPWDIFSKDFEMKFWEVKLP